MSDRARVLEKVTAFITREGEQGRELLVFQHPNASIQLPSGTIEPNESPENAVRRETWEETGLEQVEIAAYLGSTELQLNEKGYLLNDSVLQSSPQIDATLVRAPMLYRGYPVKRGELQNGFIKVTYEEFAFKQSVRERTLRQIGWIPASALATRVIRHHFHLRLIGDAPDAWSHFAEQDQGHTFNLYWVDINQDPNLAAPQDAWLEYARGAGL